MIFVNVSTGSKVASIAGTLACMLWGGIPYYAKLEYGDEERHQIRQEKVGEIHNVPVFSIKKPKQEFLDILNVIARSGNKMRKKALIGELKEMDIIKPVIGKTLTPAAEHSQLRVLLEPMTHEFGYVKVQSRGRTSTVEITEEGQNALRIFGSGS